MLTPFGKAVRKLRIDCSMTLKNMAEKLGITSAYLSAIETGKRQLTDDVFQGVVGTLNLDPGQIAELKAAAMMSVESVRIDSSSSSLSGREAAVMFARNFDALSDDDFESIMKVLEKNK